MLDDITSAKVASLVDVMLGHGSAIMHTTAVEPTPHVGRAESTSADMATAKATSNMSATKPTATHVATTKTSAHMSAATHVTTTAMSATTTVPIGGSKWLTD